LASTIIKEDLGCSASIGGALESWCGGSGASWAVKAESLLVIVFRVTTWALDALSSGGVGSLVLGATLAGSSTCEDFVVLAFSLDALSSLNIDSGVVGAWGADTILGDT